MSRILKKETEMNADLIRQYLEINGECSIIALKKRVKMNDKEFYSALDSIYQKNKIMFCIRGKIEYHNN
jgi:hypothetical protein